MPVDAPKTDVIELLRRREVDAEPVFARRTVTWRSADDAPRVRAPIRARRSSNQARPSEMSPSRNRTLVAGIGGPGELEAHGHRAPGGNGDPTQQCPRRGGDACCFVVDAGGVEVLVVGGRSALSS